ncbi:MAG: hypothetical protein Q7S54_01635, partial [bacterium]|nr:hypothetical protein [bacterium]
MKIVSTGSTLSSPEFLEKRNKARRRRTTFWIAGILALLVIAVIISRREEFLISEVSVSGAIVVKEEDIALAVEAIISGHYLFLVPKGNALIYPGGQIEKKLLQAFPRLSAVAASLEGMRLLRIDAAEREPFALYCSSALSPEDASECYFLDDNGFIFDEAPSFSGSVYFIYAKVPPLPEPVGREFLPTEEFKPLSQFIGSLEDLGIEPLAL